jgi:multidrug transporter EmrE-like cation transporter
MKSALFWFLQFVIVALEALAWYLIKQSVITNENVYLLLAMICYSLVAITISYILSTSGEGIGITNAFFNVLSSVVIVLVGMALFAETYSLAMTVGIGLGMFSILLLAN